MTGCSAPPRATEGVASGKFSAAGAEMVQGTGFEPAKHYAQRPERSPFDRSGTPAWITDEWHPVFQNGEPEIDGRRWSSNGAGDRI